MLTLGTIESALVADDNKTVRWSIRIFDTDGVGYGYYTDAIGADGWATDEAWTTGEAWFDGITNDIVLMDWNGIELRRNSSESGIMAPSDVTFTVSNPGNVYDFTKFKGGEVFIELFLWNATYGERKIQGWKFTIKTCEPGYQKLYFVCEDFLQQYLRGDYPNTRLPADIFSSERTYPGGAGVCLPVPFGTAYVPLRDVFVATAATTTIASGTQIAARKMASTGACYFRRSTGGFGSIQDGATITVAGFTNSENNGTFTVIYGTNMSIRVTPVAGFETEAAGNSVTITSTAANEHGNNYLMLGDTVNTYTITKLTVPKEFGGDEYPLATDTRTLATVFPQSTISDGTDNWRVFQAIIAETKEEKTGVGDSPGCYQQTPNTFDPCAQFTRSDTNNTDPATIIDFVLNDMGLPAADIAAFTDAQTTYTTWTLEYNGAFWYKQLREKVLSQLLTQCHSCLDVGEQISLRVLSKTSKATITSADILRTTEQGEGTFKYHDLVNEDYSDSIHVAWQQSGKPQDQFLKVLVAADAAANVISGEVLECPFVADSQDVQRIGRLYAQRKFGKVATISFTSLSMNLALQPDDVITIDDANYGGTYPVLIDSMKINKDGSINFSCTKFKTNTWLQDWTDISPTALTPPADLTKYVWKPTISGPQTDGDIGRSAFDIWGKQYLTIGVLANGGEYTDLQRALDAVEMAGGGAIYILNGTYQMTAPLYVPDVNLEVVGQSQGGVVLKNLAGAHLFVLHNLTKNFMFESFSIDDQTTAAPYEDYMLYIYGDGKTDNTGSVECKGIKIILNDDGTLLGQGDVGIYANNGQTGTLRIKNCDFTGGKYCISSNNYDQHLFIQDNVLSSAKSSGIALDTITWGKISNNNIRDNYRTAISSTTTGDILQIHGNICQARNAASGIDGTAGCIIVYAGRVSIYDNTVEIINSYADAVLYGAIQGYSNNSLAIFNNRIKINVTNPYSVTGIYLFSCTESAITGNIVSMDNDNSDSNHYGITLTSSDRNVIAGNTIDAVNNNAKDIGIYLPSGADNNQGGDNITYNCGTGISDAGAGNAVTGKDI